MTKILAINSGSSSLKFQLFEMPEEKELKIVCLLLNTMVKKLKKH